MVSKADAGNGHRTWWSVSTPLLSDPASNFCFCCRWRRPWLTCLSRCSATIASILRLRVIYMATTSTDPSWDKAPNAILAAIEVYLGLICSCVATLMPLFRRWLPASWLGGLHHQVNQLETPHSCVASDSKYVGFEEMAGKTDLEIAAGSGENHKLSQ